MAFPCPSPLLRARTCKASAPSCSGDGSRRSPPMRRRALDEMPAMTEPLQSLLLELRQTREFTAGEKGDLTRLWEKLLWRDGVGQLYTVLVYLWYGFAIFLGISVLMAVKPLAIVAPDRSAQLALAAIGFAAFFASAQWLGNRLSRSK